MKRIYCRKIITHYLAALFVATVMPQVALAQNVGEACTENPPRSGTIEFDGNSKSFFIGYRWGEGVLTLDDGREFEFNARGFKAGETGLREGKIEGVVYGMESVDDFIGHYTGLSGGILPLRSKGDITLVNSQCVFISARHTSKGMMLSLSGQQNVTIQMVAD